MDFQITTSKMILILNHLYLGDLILKSSTYDDFAHLCSLHMSIIICSLHFFSRALAEFIPAIILDECSINSL